MILAEGANDMMVISVRVGDIHRVNNIENYCILQDTSTHLKNEYLLQEKVLFR